MISNPGQTNTTQQPMTRPLAAVPLQHVLMVVPKGLPLLAVQQYVGPHAPHVAHSLLWPPPLSLVHLHEVAPHQGGTPRPPRLAVHVHALPRAVHGNLLHKLDPMS